MASIKCAVVLSIISLVVANPDTLQRLYDNPHNADHFHNHNFGLRTPENFHDDLNGGQQTEFSSSSSESRPLSSSSGIVSDAGFRSGSLNSGFETGSGSGTRNNFGVGASNIRDELLFDAVSGQTNSGSTGSASSELFDKVGSKQSNGKISSLELESGLRPNSFGDRTITKEVTVDVFKTLTNLIYNTIPVTITEFLRTTNIVPTLKVQTTPVDNLVFIATAPVTRTVTMTVTDTNTIHLFATDVSTDTYTVTHRNYDIQQQVVTSALIQTRIIKPTIVSTLIRTESEVSTVVQTVLNTVIQTPRRPSSFELRQSGFGANGNGFQHGGQRLTPFLQQPGHGAGRDFSGHQQHSGPGQFFNNPDPLDHFSGLQSSEQGRINVQTNDHLEHSGYYY